MEPAAGPVHLYCTITMKPFEIEPELVNEQGQEKGPDLA
jgi:hypothetical protein